MKPNRFFLLILSQIEETSNHKSVVVVDEHKIDQKNSLYFILDSEEEPIGGFPSEDSWQTHKKFYLPTASVAQNWKLVVKRTGRWRYRNNWFLNFTRFPSASGWPLSPFFSTQFDCSEKWCNCLWFDAVFGWLKWKCNLDCFWCHQRQVLEATVMY